MYVFSDLVQQDEGVDLTSPQPPGRLEAIATAWSRRLGGLHGVTVIAIGGGQGVGHQIDRQGEQLFEYLRHDVPFDGRLLDTVP